MTRHAQMSLVNRSRRLVSHKRVMLPTARRSLGSIPLSFRTRKTLIVRPAKDRRCEICASGFSSELNPLLRCACGVTIHLQCYDGTLDPRVAVGWRCKLCVAKVPLHLRRCELCACVGGALKEIKAVESRPFLVQRWGHVLCGLWQRDVTFEEPLKFEPLVGVEKSLLKKRKRDGGRCVLCGSDAGAIIQCAHKGCQRCFHATCARRGGYRLDVRVKEEYIYWAALCDAHSNSDSSSWDEARCKTAIGNNGPKQ